MATTDAQHSTMTLTQIHIPANVRPLDEEHVKALAGSIALQGILVPVVVSPVSAPAGDSGAEFELVAGFHRVAAASALKLEQIPVIVREGELLDSDRAIENIARKQLNAYEEARAVSAMLERGLSQAGAAQALGWPKARVSARVKILALPERAQEMLGTGALPLAAVHQLRAIGEVSPKVLDALIAYLYGAGEWALSRLASEPGWVIGQALRHGGSKTFGAYLNQAGAQEISELRLGKKTEALYAEAEKLHKQVSSYAYGPPQVRFAEQDLDQARSAGVLIELDHGSPIIVDRPLYRELIKAAIKRSTEELRVRAAELAEEKKHVRTLAGATAVDPVAEAQREANRQLRVLADQAHGVNLDLGASLLKGLSTVDPGDMDVARFFAYGVVASHSSPISGDDPDTTCCMANSGSWIGASCTTTRAVLSRPSDLAIRRYDVPPSSASTMSASSYPVVRTVRSVARSSVGSSAGAVGTWARSSPPSAA